MSYLVDTDLVIDGLHNRPDALELFAGMATAGMAVSIVTLGELFEGAYASPDPEPHLVGIRQFLAGYPILPMSEAIMDAFAREQARLRRRGQMIPDLDLLIASTALVHDLTLLTRNQRHFTRVADLRLASGESLS